MQKNKFLIYLVGSLLILSVIICSFSYNNDWIPKDFNGKTTILLIAKVPYNDKANKTFADWVADHYKDYPYEIVDTSIINNPTGKYADSKVYNKYALKWIWVQNYAGLDLDGYFHDCSTNHDYRRTDITLNLALTGYRKIIKRIIDYNQGNN